MLSEKCNRPYGISSGIVNRKSNWVWEKVKWCKCSCGMWHSNRFIPYTFWNQSWELQPNENRKKAGIIVVRDNVEVWVTQSYNRCYGFPKGEKELGETLEDCAKREFLEETGLNIYELNLGKFKRISIFIENVEYVYFVLHVPKGFDIKTFPMDDVEITSFGWLAIKDINKLFLSKAVKKVLKKHKIL